jgi:hypothetical protein
MAAPVAVTSPAGKGSKNMNLTVVAWAGLKQRGPRGMNAQPDAEAACNTGTRLNGAMRGGSAPAPYPVCDVTYPLPVRANTPARRFVIEATYDL